jgi:hypothetical protein
MADRTKLAKLLHRKTGILLDISFGGTPQPRSVTLGPSGDLRHDPTKLPLPLAPASVHTAVVTHVLEYLDPSDWFHWWDALHVAMRPLGLVFCSGPYGGDQSEGWLSDPTHKTRVVEQSFSWLDPRLPFYALHPDLGRKPPKPWHTLSIARVPGAHGTYSYNCTLQAVSMNGKAR